MIAVEGVDAHQPEIRALLERIEAQQVLRVRHRGGVVVLLLGETDGQIEGAERAGMQSLAVRDNPLVVTVRQEVTRVRLRDPGEHGAGGGALAAAHGASRRELALELDGVDVCAGGGAPLHRAPVGVDPVLVIRPRLAELMQELPQVVSALCLASVGPESGRHLLPRLGRTRMDREVRDQRVQPSTAQRDGAPGHPQRKSAEDLEVQRGIHGPSRPHRGEPTIEGMPRAAKSHTPRRSERDGLRRDARDHARRPPRPRRK